MDPNATIQRIVTADPLCSAIAELMFRCQEWHERRGAA
jgi:hypothetical protein